MAHRLLCGILLIACCCTVLSCQPTKDSLGRTLVENGAGVAAWSKDSRYLFYACDGEIRRYDTQTGEKQPYKVDEIPESLFDVSPDGKSIVFARSGDGLYVISLDTGHKRRIYYSSHKQIHGFSWLPDGHILFAQRRTPTEWQEDGRSAPRQVPLESYGVKNPGSDNAFIISPDGKKMVNVKSEFYHPFYSADGSGFVYLDLKVERYHHFSLKTKQDRLINFARKGGYGTFDLVYLSDKKLVYSTRIDNPDGISWTTKVEAIDLDTMTTKPVSLPVTGRYMGITPNYTKLWVLEPGGSDWYNRSPNKLYIMDIPPSKP